MNGGGCDRRGRKALEKVQRFQKDRYNVKSPEAGEFLFLVCVENSVWLVNSAAFV